VCDKKTFSAKQTYANNGGRNDFKNSYKRWLLSWLLKNNKAKEEISQAKSQWLMLVILATQRQILRGAWFEASLGK
jgi:hypothetical protein